MIFPYSYSSKLSFCCSPNFNCLCSASDNFPWLLFFDFLSSGRIVFLFYAVLNSMAYDNCRSNNIQLHFFCYMHHTEHLSLPINGIRGTVSYIISSLRLNWYRNCNRFKLYMKISFKLIPSSIIKNKNMKHLVKISSTLFINFKIQILSSDKLKITKFKIDKKIVVI